MNSKPILVTGGTGFIGRHLVTRLLSEQQDVVLLTRPESRLPSNLAGRVRHLVCADWNRQTLEKTLESVDFGLLYHLASYGVAPGDRDSSTLIDVNVMLPTSLVKISALHSSGIVMTGSSSEYAAPANETRIKEHSPLETKKLYGSTKAAGTLTACAVAQESKIPLIVLRLFNVYGSGEAPHRLLPCLVRNLTNKTCVPLSEGSQIRDFIYIDDIINVLSKAGQVVTVTGKQPETNIVNVSTGKGTSVRIYSETVASLLGVSSKYLSFGSIPIREDDVPWMVGDPELAKHTLDWQASYDLSSGLRETLKNEVETAK